MRSSLRRHHGSIILAVRSRSAPGWKFRTIPEGDLELCRRNWKAQISLGRAIGDESLVTSLGSLETGGCESSELKTIGVLGKEAGTRAKASLHIETEHHLNDAKITAVPVRPAKLYVVSDFTLKLRRTKSRAGYQGPELASAPVTRSIASFQASRFGTSRRHAKASRLRSKRISNTGRHSARTAVSQPMIRCSSIRQASTRAPSTMQFLSLFGA